MSRKTCSHGRLKVTSLFLAIAVIFSMSTIRAQTTGRVHPGRGATSAQRRTAAFLRSTAAGVQGVIPAGQKVPTTLW